MSLSNVPRSYLASAVVVLAILAVVLMWAPWRAEAIGSVIPPGSNVAVNCEPGQQALVRQTVVRGEPLVNIQCAGTGQFASTGMIYAPEGAYAPANLVRTSAYGPAVVSPGSSAPRPVSARRTASASRGDSRRSWQKSALVIGGTAGAGAGIGALIGGKKGALIGAAIGGGGATLYEVVKR